MTVLDTNVVSEAMKPAVDAKVRAWLNDQAEETQHPSSVTLAERLFGIGTLPSGRRKDALAATLEGLLELFGPRVLPFDADAARCHAPLAAKAGAAGRGFSTPDGYIAAIAVAHGFAVATRDTGAFLAADVAVIDPWRAR